MCLLHGNQNSISISGPQRFQGKLITADAARKRRVSRARKTRQEQKSAGAVDASPPAPAEGRPGTSFAIQGTLRRVTGGLESPRLVGRWDKTHF